MTSLDRLRWWPALLGLTLGVVLGSASAGAQVTVAPGAVEAFVPAGQHAEVALAVTNEGDTPLSLFAVPLPESGAPDDVGELLFHTEPATVDDARGLAMTPDGRLFAATYGGGPGDDGTREYARGDLAFLRSLDTPRLDRENTTGLAWIPPEHAPPGHPEGTLWWLSLDTDCEQSVCTVVTTLAIEGDLDGNTTGRTIALTTGPGVPDLPSFDRGLPFGLAYDPGAVGPSGAPGLFYYTDIINESFYAVDLDGAVAEGYPVPLSDYDPGGQRSLFFNSTLDATRGPDGAGYFEVGFVLESDTRFERVVLTDRQGRNTGVETPLNGLAGPDGEGELLQVNGVLRSRIDPSVMYLSVLADPSSDPWIYAIRAAPLPPGWLRASAAAPASLSLAAGATDTLTVKLNAEGLEVGAYAGLVELRSGGPNGEGVASIPVRLTVTEGTDGEGEVAAPAASSLAVYPNPTAGRATVTLALPNAAEVRVAVYDVLGREVAVLHEGPLAAGPHRIAFDADLPTGVYLVRFTGDGFDVAQRVTVIR